MAEARIIEKCKVTVSEDSMSATLFVEPPSDGIAYGVDELADFVKSKGVYGGIMYSAIEELSQNNIYYKDHVIAKGALPTEGTEGYYEVLFDYEKRKSPLIRSDGSVDYQSMSEINVVDAGDKLIVYHPAVQGTHGYDVRGRSLRCRPCKDLPKIKGVGFDYDDDTGVYSASVGGRIEYDGRTMRISEIYEHRGDLDLVVGKIDFKGDVVVKGNVLSGTYIRASKSITVEGSVESATLIAGTDVVLKKGMQGGNRARVSAGGDVYANFLEFTTVDAKGKVEANIIMNCNVTAGQDINISGKRGALMGGSTWAIGKINTTFLGNSAGLKTVAGVGITKEIKDRKKGLLRKYEVVSKEIETLEKEILKVTDMRVAKEDKEVREVKKSQLTRKLDRSKHLFDKLKEEIKEIEQTEGVGKRASISVGNEAYIGVTLSVDDVTTELTRNYRKIEVRKSSLGDCLDIKEG